MFKHLFIYFWIFSVLILGILVCLGIIAWMLLTRTPYTTFFPQAQLVKEMLFHAAI